MNSLSQIVALLIILSVAAERLVEIIKNLLPSDWLSKENPNPQKEEWRKFSLQLLAVGAGMLTAFLAKALGALPKIEGTAIQGIDTKIFGLILLGLLASGGSGFWTSILTYVSKLKEIKKSEAAMTRVRAAEQVYEIAKKVLATTSGETSDSDKLVAARKEGKKGALSDAQTLAKANLIEAIRIANATL